MVHDMYKRGFEKHGQSPKALHWVSYASQAVRFKHLVADVEIEDRSILDAGCGMGDILPFLYAKADRFDYLGVDMNKDFINIAKKRYSGHSFKVGDPFFDRIRTKYDVVLSSGVMNHNVKNWQDIRRQMIAALFEQTGETLAFNMAGASTIFRRIGKSPMRTPRKYTTTVYPSVRTRQSKRVIQTTTSQL